MNPDYQNPTPFMRPPQPNRGKKKLFLIIGGLVALVAIAATAFLLLPKAQQKNDQQAVNSNEPASIKFGTEKDPVTYAGHKMYDACNLMPISVLNAHVGKFEETSKSLGTDKKLDDPLMMDHGYVDRNITSVQSGGDKAREPGTAVSETGIDATVRARSFMSIGDSHCTYAQGRNFNSSFAAVYVIQPPQPLHPKLIAHLDSLKAQGRLAIESQGVQVYVEPTKEGDDSYVAIFRKGGVVVFLKSLNYPLIQAASDEIVKNLQAPAGPLTTTFTGPYAKLTDTCKLFTASDFERALGKPASAVTSEEISLTEVEDKTAARKCTRIEVERFREGEISSTNIQLAVSRTEDLAKNSAKTLKDNKDDTVLPLRNLGDEAYAITDGFSKRHSIVVRVKNALLTVESSGEVKDADLQAFIARTEPIAQTVVKNYSGR